MDTNLLVLWVTGWVSPSYIAHNKNLKAYGPDDFDILVEHVGEDPNLVLLPHVLAETSNLLSYASGRTRDRVFEAFRLLIEHCDEAYVSSRTAAAMKDFIRLGLADCAMLSAKRPDFYILTDDLQCYLTAERMRLAVVNYQHLRQRSPKFW